MNNPVEMGSDPLQSYYNSDNRNTTTIQTGIKVKAGLTLTLEMFHDHQITSNLFARARDRATTRAAYGPWRAPVERLPLGSNRGASI